MTNTAAKNKMGRPRMSKDQKKVNRSIYLRPALWEKLKEIDENPSVALERLVEKSLLINLVKMETRYQAD